jgi:uncharacterized damage-inducible protein DinB
MFTLDGICKFHAWTHACITRALDHLSTIPEEHYVKEVSGFGFPTLRAQVIHIFNCEGFWIHTLKGHLYVDRDPTACLSVADARALQHAVSAETIAYLSVLTDLQLNTPTELYFSDGDAAIRTPALILHHVLTHACHHKGQIAAMCRVLGYPAPDTDMNQMEG